MSVLLVDDQAPFLAAGRAVVSRIDGFEVVGEADSGEHGIELATDLVPDLILMDINLGGIDGIEATRRITADRHDAFVILVSTYPLEDLPGDARSCGAARLREQGRAESSTYPRLVGERRRSGLVDTDVVTRRVVTSRRSAPRGPAPTRPPRGRRTRRAGRSC